MYVLNVKANYDLGDLGKQNSYNITKYFDLKRVSQGIDDFKHSDKHNQFFNIILFQFVFLTTY